METTLTEIEQPQTEIKLLVHADDAQIQRITEETTIRKQLLNDLLEAGIREYEIPDLSKDYIEKLIWDKHLQSNKPMSLEFSNGKKQKYLQEAYTLPDNLIHLKRIMERWVNYLVPYRGFDKFRHLTVVDGRYQLDQESLEREFEVKKLKLFVGPEKVDKIKALDLVIDYLIAEDCPPHQVLETNFFGQRLTRDSSLGCNRLTPKKYFIKKSYLVGKD
jgi:hypothetical protein